MSKLRGISPVVSVVLMIAVAISIGILVTTWVTSWIQRETTSPDISCAMNTNYVIDNVEWNKTGFNSSLLIKITNKGRQKLYGFGTVIDNGTKINEFSSSVVDQGGISSTNTLGRERSVYIIVNMTNSSLDYPEFGKSLTISNEVVVKVTNEACDAVSSDTSSVD